MIEIDGSMGGGQLLRTAVGLSALTKQPMRITNIRTARKECKPGLRPQHLMGVKVLEEFCNAEIRGDKVGSLEVEFFPKDLRVTSKEMDIGTAGNIGLLLQTLTPLLVFTKKHVTLQITGGTETRWAPTILYIQYITYQNLNRIGTNLEIEIVKHGYYPKGGGLVIVESKPINKLKPLVCSGRGQIKSIHIHSVCGNLPSHIAERQGKSALRTIRYHFPNVKTSLAYKNVKSACAGTSVTCYAVCDNSVLGGSSLGKIGVRAETVGERAAEELVQSLKSNACFDKYMADQILPFLALSEGESHVTVERITDHCLTNIKVIEKFLPVKFNVKGKKNELGEISIVGAGFERYQPK